MKTIVFKAFALTNEINLNEIALSCKIPKKYTWEEPLELNCLHLKQILKREFPAEASVHVFAFGSVVFLNFNSEQIEQFILYLKTIEPEIKPSEYKVYSDDYELRIYPKAETELSDEYVNVPTEELFYPELVSTVIAKSVALEKTEAHMQTIMDKLEGMIERLEKGNLSISHKQLAKITSQILRLNYNTINYIMILDKPDITWVNSDAEAFYDQMSQFFELTDRYEIMQNKLNILNSVKEGFSTISSSMRGLVLEWIVIILILVEVIIMLLDLFK